MPIAGHLSGDLVAGRILGLGNRNLRICEAPMKAYQPMDRPLMLLGLGGEVDAVEVVDGLADLGSPAARHARPLRPHRRPVAPSRAP
jgi:hypothetical protein